MNTGSIECFAGISGDMMLGALIAAGVPAALLETTAAGLGIGATLHVYSVNRSGIQATRVEVLENGHPADGAEHDHHHGDGHHHDHGDHPHHHHDGHEHHEHQQGDAHAHSHARNWPQIRGLIHAAAVSEGAKRIALRAFELLAEAEAKVHGVPVDQVHFHEVGAVDSIVDIVCSAVGLDSLGVSQWRCTPVNVGSGFVNCDHGRFPVPAPATAELLKGIPVYSAGPQMELTTPTGAALLRALDCRFDDRTPLTISALGYGAGNRNPEAFPNVLRLSVGTVTLRAAGSGFHGDRVMVLECALDDATPQVLAHAMDLALEQGALDVTAAPLIMKKGRPGTLLTVLARPGEEQPLQRLLFRETTTLGIRCREEDRVILDRAWVSVDTEYGKIRVKIASSEGEIFNAMPEYEDCRRAAREHSVSLRAAMEAALAAWAESKKASA